MATRSRLIGQMQRQIAVPFSARTPAGDVDLSC
jgi:hypothetical protein